MPGSPRCDPNDPRVQRLSAVVAAAVVVLAAVRLFGGFGGDAEVLAAQAGEPVLVRSGAVGLLLLACLTLWRLRWPGQVGGPNGALAAGAVAAVAVADLLTRALGLATGLDALLAAHLDFSPPPPTAPATAVCILLAAVCLTCLSGRSATAVWALIICGTVGLIAALVAVVGYLFDAQALYNVPLFTAISPLTAVAFALLFSALLVMRCDIGWVGLMFGPGAGSRSARRVIPTVVLVSLGSSFAALLATEAGWFTANFRLSVIAITTIALIGAIVLRSAAIQNRTEDRLFDLTERLAAALSQRDHLIGEIHHRVKGNLQQVVALLQLEASKAPEAAVRDALQATTARIAALGAVPRLMLAADHPSHVEAPAFVEHVIKGTLMTLPAADERLTVETEADDFLIHVETASVLGLLVSELLTRRLNRVPGGGWLGVLRVSLLQGDDGQVTLKLLHAGGAAGEWVASGGDGAVSVTSDRIAHGLAGQLHASLLSVNEHGLAGLEIRIPARALHQESPA